MLWHETWVPWPCLANRGPAPKWPTLCCRFSQLTSCSSSHWWWPDWLVGPSCSRQWPGSVQTPAQVPLELCLIWFCFFCICMSKNVAEGDVCPEMLSSIRALQAVLVLAGNHTVHPGLTLLSLTATELRLQALFLCPIHSSSADTPEASWSRGSNLERLLPCAGNMRNSWLLLPADSVLQTLFSSIWFVLVI